MERAERKSTVKILRNLRVKSCICTRAMRAHKHNHARAHTIRAWKMLHLVALNNINYTLTRVVEGHNRHNSFNKKADYTLVGCHSFLLPVK